LVLSIGFMWPMIVHMRTRIVGGADTNIILWAYWHFPKSLGRFQNPFSTNLLFFPVGANLAFGADAPLVAVLTWPFAHVLGIGGTANLFQVIAVYLSALGAYALAFHVCRDRWASFFAGAAFAFAPYRFFHAQGHLHVIHTELIAFGLLAIVRLHERPTRGRAVTLGVVIGVTFMVDLYFTVFLLLAALVVSLWNWRRSLSREFGLRWLQTGVVALVVSLPLFLPMVNAYRAGEAQPYPAFGGAELHSADLLAWVLPPPNHPVLKRWTAKAYRGIKSSPEGWVYPGLTTIALAVAGFASWRKAGRGLWLLLAGVNGILALGPFLHVNGWTGSRYEVFGSRFSVPLPFFVFHRTPVLSGVRAPGRFGIVTILALTVLAALGLTRLRERSLRLGAGVTIACLALLIFEFLPPPLPTFSARVPRVYDAIASDPGTGAVLDVPLEWKTGITAYGDPRRGSDHSRAMFFATVHGKSLAGGYVSFLSDVRLKELSDITVYRQVMAMQGERLFRRDPGFGRRAATFTVEDLRVLGIGFVVCHREPAAERACSYLAGLRLPVLAEGDGIIAWKVPPASG
jgi:hypothetical protein